MMAQLKNYPLTTAPLGQGGTMLILAAIAGVAASTMIYSLENVVDRKVTTKIQERRAEKIAAQKQQDAVAEAAPAPAPEQVYVPATQVTAPAAMEVQAPAQAPAPTAREAALEAQLQQMQAAFAQLQAAQAQAQTAVTTPAPAAAPAPAEEPLVKKGQLVAICDTATPAEGDLDSILPPDKRQGRVVKIIGDGTVKVNVSLGGKAGAKSITVSEYDVIPV